MKIISRYSLAISVVVISLATVLVYREILFVPGQVELFPWGFDALNHIMKAEYIRQNLAEGVIYPEFFPNWYLGAQVFRYYPPLPYYMMIAISAVTGLGLVKASAWTIALCAWLGGLLWLPFRRWIGWLPAMLGGLLYLILPDNLRVAFLEGNFPRLLSTALIPLLVYLVLRSLEDTGTPWHRIGLALSFGLCVLCHAMLTAIYGVCCAMLVLACFVGRVTSFRRTALSLASIFFGILLSGWWLLPSLTGGITEQDLSFWSTIVYPLSDFLNPWTRQGSLEVIYIGAALLILGGAGLFYSRGRSPQTVGLALTGLAGVLINTPGFNAFFNALPLHTLLIPYRWLGIAGFMLLLAVLWQAQAVMKKGSVTLALVVVGLVAIDSAASLPLLHYRPAEAEIPAIAEKLAILEGWRVATLDINGLGAEPAYFFTAVGGREQVYGWSYNAARAAATISALDEAIIQKHDLFLVDRLNLLGVDDIVVANSLPSVTRIKEIVDGAGFQPVFEGQSAVLYHRDGEPRAIRAGWPALGIGYGARNLAYLFPQVIVGTSTYVDDYILADLTRYKTVVLAGFRWRHRSQAEALVRQVVEAGVNVVIDLTGAPDDPVARIPRFLGVWGERIILSPEPVLAHGPDGDYSLEAFGEGGELWYTLIPQGLQVETMTFNYLDEQAALVGYNTYGRGRAWFIGINLPFHAMLTGDSEAVRLLSDLMELPQPQANHYDTVPLQNYRASHLGYRFEYNVDQPGLLLLPVAYHEGMVVTIDNQPAAIQSFENLLVFEAPGGSHHVEVRQHRTPIYRVGLAASVLAFLAVLGLLLAGLRPREKS